MPSQIRRVVRHDTANTLRIDLEPPDDPDRTWDLQTPGVTLRLTARLPDAPTYKFNSTATASGPWQVKYKPVAGDIDTVGRYALQVVAVKGDDQLTLPSADVAKAEAGVLYLDVVSDLDNQ